MAADYRSYAETTSGSTSTAIVNKPTGTISGDLLIAQYRVNRSSITITPPAGWTSIRKDEQGARSSELFYKLAGGSEGTDYSFSHSGGNEAVVATITCFSGCSLTAGVGANNGQANGAGGPSSPGVTPVASNNIVLIFVTNENTTTAAYAIATSSPTFVEVYDAGAAGYRTAMAYGLRSAATATGTATATGDSANITQILSLTPADDITIVPSTPVSAEMRLFQLPMIITAPFQITASVLSLIAQKWQARGKNSATWEAQDKTP